MGPYYICKGKGACLGAPFPRGFGAGSSISLFRLIERRFPGRRLVSPFPTGETELGPASSLPHLLSGGIADVAAGEECRYSGHCTFAYCQEEIDVWTLERKGAFSREALFEGSGEISLTVSRLLQEHHGLFMFLCEVLFFLGRTRELHCRAPDCFGEWSH